MNQKYFEELVNDSRLLNKDTLSELEQLLKEYPFCQTFHLLYTKNLYLQKHIRYHQQLKLAAAVVGDRTRLKYYIEDSNVTINIVSKQSSAPAEILSESKKEIERVPLQTESLKINSEKEKITAESRVNIRQQAEGTSKSSASNEWDADDESVLLSTLDAEVSREEKKKAIIALINKKFTERIVASGYKMPDKLTAETVSVDKDEVKPEINSGRIEQLDEDQKDSIGSTKERIIDLSQAVDLPLHNVIENDSQDQLESLSGNENSESLNEQSPSSVKKEVTASNVLIEKFLRDAPRMPRPKKEFYNPVNLAARSIEENEDFYTETYASICLKQGNAVKAIKIYEKLSLKFPEKSSYFAGLIEKIKKEQNI